MVDAEVLHQETDPPAVAPEQAVPARLEGASVEHALIENLLDARAAFAEIAVRIRQRFAESGDVHLDAVGDHLVALADKRQGASADEGRPFEHEHALALVLSEQRRRRQAGHPGADDDGIDLLVRRHNSPCQSSHLAATTQLWFALAQAR